MTYRLHLLAAAVVLLLAGCRSGGEVNRLPKDPKMPPPPPKMKAVVIEPSLLREAENVLNRTLDSSDAQLGAGNLPNVLRANVIEAMQKTQGVAAAPRIIAGLSDRAPLVRFASALAAGRIPLPQAYPVLLRMTEDSSASVQIAVRFALHMLGDKRLSHDFELFVQNPNPRVRANAVTALGLINEPSALALLKSIKGELDPDVRLQIVEARYRLGDPQATDQLLVGCVSGYPDEQIFSMLALASSHNEKVAMSMLGHLTSDYPEVGLAAARALGEVGIDEGMTVALNGTTSKDQRQRSMAALALGDIGRTDAQPALKKLIADPDPSVRIAAATAVLQLTK